MGLSSKATVSQGKSIARVVAPPAEQIFQPASGGLVLTGYAPIAGGASAFPAAGSLVLTGGVPVYGGVSAKPAAGSLVLTGQVPSTFPLANIIGWWNAETLGLNDGDSISTWTDISGLGNDLTAAALPVGQRPVYKTAIKNGRPVVRFTRASTQKIYLAFTYAQPMTWFLAGSVRSNTSTQMLIASYDDNAFIYNPGVYPSAPDFNAGTALTSSVTVSSGEWRIFSVVANGASSKFGIDATTTSGNPGTLGTGGLCLGARVNAGNFSDLDAGEAIAYTGAMSDADRTIAITYLMGRWT